MRVLLAYSGGLDTSYLVAWYARERVADVTTLAVDCGGWSDAERAELERRALTLGAVEHRLVDARGELFERVLRWLVAANVRRGETYPLCVGAERGLQAEIIARTAADEGFDIVAHGSTGAGNDQVRFDAALHALAPEVTLEAPVRDHALSRAEEAGYLAALGHAYPAERERYSINAGLWGVSIGGGELATSGGALPEHAWHWTRGGAGERTLELAFEHGRPVAIDGEPYDPVDLIERLNRIGGELGVGRGYHLGDTLLGFKGRIAFEAPAACLLLAAHRELEKLVLTEEQRFWKDHLGNVYGRRLHQGLFHDPFQRDLEAFFASSQARVTGAVRVAVQGGACLVEGVESPFSLMTRSDAVYGELPSQRSSGGAALARTLAEPARLWRLAGLGPQTA
ncbi:MAG: argininosuccinate synthase [Planctomycetota bacterium]